MSTLASTILTNTRILLHDTGGDPRWEDAELLGWLNEGQREIVGFRPDATATRAVITLQEGTAQVIPSDGWRILRVIRNMGANGATPGRAISLIGQESMDSISPNWHFDPAMANVQHYMTDPMAHEQFNVYPPQPAADFGQVDILYSVTPPDVAGLANNISLDDIFSPVLTNYIVYRTLVADSADPSNAVIAEGFYQKYFSSLMGQATATTGSDPKAVPT